MNDALARALAKSPMTAALLDDDGTILACDGALSTTLRRPVKQTVGHTIWRLGPSFDEAGWLGLRDRARQSGCAESETLGFDPSGTSSRVRVRIEAVDGMAPARYLLREDPLPPGCSTGPVHGAHPMHRWVTDATEDGSWAWKVGTDTVVLNRRWREMFGISTTDASPTVHIARHLHPENHASVLRDVERLIGGEVDRIDTRIRVRLADGGFRWFRHRVYVAVRSASGQPEWLAGHDVDITDEMEAEARALAHARALGSVVDRLPVGVFVYGPDGRPRSWNQEGSILSNRPRDVASTVARWPHDGWVALDDHGQPLPEDEVPLTVALRTGEAVRNKLLGFAKDGRLRWILASAAPALDDDGQIVDVVCTAIDVTEIVEARTAFAYWRRLEIMGRLAAGVAHDFNNLLTVVSTSAELLSDELSLDSPGQDDIAEIRAASARGARITRDLLGYACRQRRVPVVVSLVGAPALETTALRLHLPDGARVERVIPDDLWSVHIDPAQLQQVVAHLVSNAGDALPEGRGTVTLTARNAHVERTVVAASLATVPDPGDYVVLTVRDDGRGMSPDLLQRCTDPFFTTKEGTMRCGLGLSSSLGIARQNGGQLVVESAPGEGTTVELWLPRAPAG